MFGNIIKNNIILLLIILATIKNNINEAMSLPKSLGCFAAALTSPSAYIWSFCCTFAAHKPMSVSLSDNLQQPRCLPKRGSRRKLFASEQQTQIQSCVS